MDKPKVLILASTGADVVNFDGTTIHSPLHIPVGYFGRNLPGLSDKMKSSLRNKYSELKVLMIDEVVSNDLLFNIHLRLVEIFGCQSNKPFAGLTVITIGNLSQLQPIRAKPVYMHFGDTWNNFEPLWRQFKIVEPTEVMQQKEIII